MALDNWFQNWHPPHFLPPFYEPIKNYSSGHDYHSAKKTPNPSKLIPFLLSLNLLKPPEVPSEKKRHRPSTYFAHISPKNIKYDQRHKNIPNFKVPLEHLDVVDKNEGSKSGFEVPHLGIFSQEEKYSNKLKNNDSNPRIRLESPNKKEKDLHFNLGIPLEYPGHFYTESLGFPDPFKENTRHKIGNITYEEEHRLKPLELTGPFKTWYRWKILDLKYPSDLERSRAIASGDFIPENNLPLGIEVYKNRIFVSMPKWKTGVPVTLAQLPRVPREESPQLEPYPSWDWHSEKSCDLITSVFRMYVDECGRLWVLDSGKVSITTDEAKQHCPPKLLIFDLETDELLDKFVFPDSLIKEDGLYSNIVIDIRQADCHDAYAYMADVWRFGLVVFRLIDHKAWRVTDHLFFPDPLAASYQLHHLKFDWTDGIFGIALSSVEAFNDERILYFHPMSSFREFYVKTSYLRDEDSDEDRKDVFSILGQSRGPSGHVSSSVMDENGIMYYNLVTRDSIGCWDSRKPYKRENLGVIAKSKDTLVFPNDMRLDKEERQSMWIITNRLPYYLIEGLDISRINFRIMSAYTDESIKGTICNPEIHKQNTYVEYKDDGDCY